MLWYSCVLRTHNLLSLQSFSRRGKIHVVEQKKTNTKSESEKFHWKSPEKNQKFFFSSGFSQFMFSKVTFPLALFEWWNFQVFLLELRPTSCNKAFCTSLKNFSTILDVAACLRAIFCSTFFEKERFVCLKLAPMHNNTCIDGLFLRSL